MRTAPVGESIFVALASALAGICLLMASYADFRPVAIHIGNGDYGAAAFTGLVGVIMFFSALALLMPGWRGRLAALAVDPLKLALLRFWALLIALILMGATVIAARAMTNDAVMLSVFGAGAVLVCCFIGVYLIPGLALRPYLTAQPAKPVAWLVPQKIESRFLRAVVLFAPMLWIVSIFVWMFAPVVPDQRLIAFLVQYGWLVTLAVTALCLPAIMSARVAGSAEPRAAMLARFKAVAGGAVAAGLFVATFALGTLPYGWNVIAQAPERVKIFIVKRVAAGTGGKGCRWNVNVVPEEPGAYSTTLCRVNNSVIGRAKPGDRLVLHGQIGPFGMTYNAATLLPAE